MKQIKRTQKGLILKYIIHVHLSDLKRRFLFTLLASIYICCGAQTVYIDGFNYSLDPETGNAVILGAPWQDDDLLKAGVLDIPQFVRYKGKEYSVTEIGDNAFAYWTTPDWVNIPNTIMIIGEGAFHGCTNVRMFAGGLPILTTIKAGAFSNCYSITTFFLPPSLQYLGDRAFENCRSLQAINFSITFLKEIPYGVCRGCKNLRTVIMFGDGTIPVLTGIKQIRENAFEGCDIGWISLPRTLEHIGSEAFKKCPLNLVTCAFNDPFVTDVNVFDVYETATLEVPKGTMHEFKEVSSWNLFWNVKESENTSIVSPQTRSINNNSMSIYDLCGRKQNNLRKGFNIIRTNEGIRKIVMNK